MRESVPERAQDDATVGAPTNALPTHWPRGQVVTTSSELPPPAAAAPTGSLTITLDGHELQTLDALTTVLSDQLALPAFTTGSPERVASAVDRRLFVMEKANEFVTITLHSADAVPEPVLSYLLKLVTATPLRVAFTGAPDACKDSSRLLSSLGITLLDLSPPESAAALEEPSLHPTTDADSTDAVPEPEPEPEPDNISAVDEADLAAFPDAEPTDEPKAESDHRRWYLVAGATALTAAALWYVRTEAPVTADIDRPQPALSAPSVATELPQSNPTEAPPRVTAESRQAPHPEPVAEATPTVTKVAATESAQETETETATLQETATEQGTQPVTEPAPATSTRVPATGKATAPAPAPAARAATTDTVKAPVAQTESAAPAESTANAVPLAGYTIQIASYASAAVRAEYLQDMQNRPSELRPAEAIAGGTLKNLLVYGSYPDYGSAARAIRTLPEALRKAQPFPIKASKLKPE